MKKKIVENQPAQKLNFGQEKSEHQESESGEVKPEIFGVETENIETAAELAASDEAERAERLKQIQERLNQDNIEPREVKNLFEQYQNREGSLASSELSPEKKPLRKLFGSVNEVVVRFLYRKFPEVVEGNNPQSENFYLKKVDSFNQEQEKRAEQLGFNKRVAFFGHIHSRGETDWRDGSDGSSTPKQLAEQYQQAVQALKEQGIDEVYAIITDHNAVGNSLEFAELLEQQGVIKPIVGCEVASKEGYETLVYTSDRDELKDFYDQSLEPGLGKVLRYAKSGRPGKELIDEYKKRDFVMGISHPAAAKAIIWGGTTQERFAADPELKDKMAENAAFYEGLNWFQNVRGSNCIAFNLREQMAELGIEAFANSDYHSSVSGNEQNFFGGMYTEIRTNQDIGSGQALLELLQQQKKDPNNPAYVPIMRGLPATEKQYKEHLNNATGRVIRTVIKALTGRK